MKCLHIVTHLVPLLCFRPWILNYQVISRRNGKLKYLIRTLKFFLVLARFTINHNRYILNVEIYNRTRSTVVLTLSAISSASECSPQRIQPVSDLKTNTTRYRKRTYQFIQTFCIFFFDCNKNLNVSTIFNKNPKYHKTPSVGGSPFPCGRSDRQTLFVTACLRRLKLQKPQPGAWRH
jgi:hypothetical protein